MLARAVKNIKSQKTAVKSYRKLHTSRKPAATIPFHSAAQLIAEDTQLSKSTAFQQAKAKFGKLASKDAIQKAKAALEKNGLTVTVVPDRKTALSTLQSLIPDQSSINLASSTSLNEIGFIDYLTTTTRWNNLKATVIAEKDAAKQAELRRLATVSDYCITSLDAVTENGEFVMVDASGTRVGLPYAAAKTIFVVGSQKIVKNLDEANERASTYSYALESARVRQVYPGAAGSTLANQFAFRTSLPYNKGRFHILFVEDTIGY